MIFVDHCHVLLQQNSIIDLVRSMSSCRYIEKDKMRDKTFFGAIRSSFPVPGVVRGVGKGIFRLVTMLVTF